MERFYSAPTDLSPEIILSPEENIFKITGRSSPEDVRTLYYPVIDWLKDFIKETIKENPYQYSASKPVIVRFEFTYFNSSSAKFINDILLEIKRLNSAGINVIIEWVHDEEDIDLMEAGEDIAILTEMEFKFISKKG